MDKEDLCWRGLYIKYWKNISAGVLLKTPVEILEAIAETCWPVRILKDNIFQFGLHDIGTIKSFERKKGSVTVNLKPMNIDPEQKGSNIHAVVVSKKSGFSLGLPKFK